MCCGGCRRAMYFFGVCFLTSLSLDYSAVKQNTSLLGRILQQKCYGSVLVNCCTLYVDIA